METPCYNDGRSQYVVQAKEQGPVFAHHVFDSLAEDMFQFRQGSV